MDNLTDNLTERLGFYFVIFQRDISDFYVRCWIDGEETYNLMPTEEFLGYVKLANDLNLYNTAKYFLNETSLYIWDVESGIMKRLHADSFEKSNMMAEINKKGNDILKENRIKKNSGGFTIENIFNASKDILNKTFRK